MVGIHTTGDSYVEVSPILSDSPVAERSIHNSSWLVLNKDRALHSKDHVPGACWLDGRQVAHDLDPVASRRSCRTHAAAQRPRGQYPRKYSVSPSRSCINTSLPFWPCSSRHNCCPAHSQGDPLRRASICPNVRRCYMSVLL